MSGQSLFLETLDIRVAKAGKVVVAFVVFPDMVKAEAEILTLPLPTDRRTMGARRITAIPLTARRTCVSVGLLVGPDPDFLEIFRVHFHRLPGSCE
jgi:hypothetical protein